MKLVTLLLVLTIFLSPLVAVAQEDRGVEEFTDIVISERPSISYEFFSPGLPIVDFFKRVFNALRPSNIIEWVCDLPGIENICE